MSKQQRSKSQQQKPIVRINAPVSRGLVFRNNAPQFRQAQNGSIVVKHREYIADVAGSVSFASVSYSINPALIVSFPWLYATANQYESYHFRNLHYIYEPACSTSTAGTVMLAVDYDAIDAAPGTKSQVMTYHGAVRSSVWEEVRYVALHSNLDKYKTRYTRSAALVANQDIKTFDVGNLFVCTALCAGTSNIGELYVEYEVELQTPQQNPIAGITIGSAILNSSAGFAQNLPFGTNLAVSSQIGSVFSVSSQTITANAPIQCIFNIYYGTSGSGGVTWSAPTLSNATYTLIFAQANPTSGGAQSISFLINFLGPGATIVPNLSAITNSAGNTVNTCVIRIGNYAYSLA